MKKMLSLILAVALVLTICAVSAFAIAGEYPEYPIYYTNGYVHQIGFETEKNPDTGFEKSGSALASIAVIGGIAAYAISKKK